MTIHGFSLSIAGITLELRSDYPLVTEVGYLPFVTARRDAPDIHIDCIGNIPKHLKHREMPLFEAKNGTQRFYSIFVHENNGFLFLIYNQQNGEIQQIALTDSRFEFWEIYCEPQNGQLIPLQYPLGPIIMHYMTLNSNAVLMHASCAFDGKTGRLFSGFSGAGKSTISGIMSCAGHQIINDDRIIIRKETEGYFAYNTPMYYADRPKRAKLDAIYLISHSPENTAKLLHGASAVSKVMAFCIQNNFDRRFVSSRLDFFAGLCSKVNVYELGFVPENHVVNFILENERKHRP